MTNLFTTLGIGTMVMVAALVAFAIATLIANWKILEKMGDKGWKALIPVYGRYVLFEHVWDGKMYLAMLACSILTSVLHGVQATGAVAAMIGFGSFACTAMFVVLTIMFSYKLAKAFGHGKGYTAGLLFLNPIFTMILGFGKDQYQAA